MNKTIAAILFFVDKWIERFGDWLQMQGYYEIISQTIGCSANGTQRRGLAELN